MKILVINEPFVKDFCRTQRWAARTRGRVLRAPDWLAYATAVLEKYNHNVKLIDMVANSQTKDNLKDLIKKEQPDFVVLDSTTPSIYSDIECAQIAKEESVAKVIMVGPHVSALPEETLLLAKGAVDVVCIGEYDYTVKDVVENFNNLNNVKGIAFYGIGKYKTFLTTETSQGRVLNPAKRRGEVSCQDGVVKINEQKPLIEDLDELPFPAWHHLDLMKYFDGGKLYPYIDIISGRGCPNQCIFCLWPQIMHGTRYRLRSPKNVVDEIEYDIKLCPQVIKGGEFFFEDDTFTVNKERAIQICEEILRRNLKITFSVNARADTADLELFRIMKKAGCRELLVGFESGNQEVLNKMNKNIMLGQAYKFMELAKNAKLEVHGCFVIGLPGETEETAKETLNFALKLGLTTLQFSGAVPFPGTAFFELCKKEGWLKTEYWSDWLNSGEQAGIVKYPDLSQEKINYYVDSGLKRFYLRLSYMIKFALKNRSLADLYRKLRGAWNFLTYLFNGMEK